MSLVRLRNVQKTYRSLQGADYVAVERFDLAIEPGEFFCLLGPSGCGNENVGFGIRTRGMGKRER